MDYAEMEKIKANARYADAGNGSATMAPLTGRIEKMVEEAVVMSGALVGDHQVLLDRLFGPTPVGVGSTGQMARAEPPSFEERIMPALQQLLSNLAHIREQTGTLNSRV